MLHKRLWNLEKLLNDKVKTLFAQGEEKIACGPPGYVIQHKSRHKIITAPNSIANSG